MNVGAGLARCVIRWRWGILAALVVITGSALGGVLRVRLDPSNARLFPRHGEAAQVYQQFLSTFGSDETLLVALHDPHNPLVTPAGLAAIGDLTQALAGLSQVAAVHSLTNAPDMARLRITTFGLALPRLIPALELSPEQREALRQNRQIRGRFLSVDQQTAGVLVIPHAEMTSAKAHAVWIAAVRAVAAQHAVQGRQTYVAGTPLERNDVTAYLQRDQRLIVPLVLLILVGLTWRLYGVKRFALLALVCVVLPLLWTIGVVGYRGIALNVITSLLPAVILVVSVSTVIHLLNQYVDVLAAGVHGTRAIEQTLGEVGLACFFTAITTAIGFFFLAVSPIPAVQDFALLAGIGVLFSFAGTIISVPLALFWWGAVTSPRQTESLAQRLEQLTHWVAAHRGMVFTGSAIVLLVALPGIGRIQEGTDIVRALRQRAPLRVSSEFIDHHLTGVNALEVLLNWSTNDAGGAVAPTTIRQVLAFSHWLRAQPHVTAVFSPWEPLRGVRQEMLAHDDQLTVLATMLPLAFPLDSWLDTTRNVVRISARVTAISSDRFLALADTVQRQAARDGWRAQITGRTYLLAQMSRTLVRTQILSLAGALVLILGCIALLLRSWRLGLIAAVPNLLPTVVIFGIMGWSGIALSTATVMIASVALGLLVDDTIHLLYRYAQQRRAGAPPLAAMTHAVRHAGRAVLFTTLILTLGFWAGLLGSFKPTLFFSFLTGLTMLLALVAELLVTPATVLAVAGGEQDADED